jgi:hypothetical protein
MSLLLLSSCLCCCGSCLCIGIILCEEFDCVTVGASKKVGADSSTRLVVVSLLLLLSLLSLLLLSS